MTLLEQTCNLKSTSSIIYLFLLKQNTIFTHVIFPSYYDKIKKMAIYYMNNIIYYLLYILMNE